MTEHLRRAGLAIGLIWSLFQLWIVLGPGLSDMVVLPVHAMLAVAVAFAIEPARMRDVRDRGLADLLISILAVAIAGAIAAYFVMNADPLARRIPMVQSPDTMQMVIGVLIVALVLEAARRTSGWGIVSVVLVGIAYAMFGWKLPSGLATTQVTLVDFIDLTIFTTGGVFGVPLSVSATYVFYFVLFAAFLEVSGGGKLFIDVALALTKRTRGGPAKAAVIGSALMGMASGSAVANVVSTGVFTIPLMKSAGYKPRIAAAIEALASTGAQIMPPLMGAAAFIMANTLGIAYREIVVVAILPALLYFSTVFLAVDFEARKQRIEPTDQTEGTWKDNLLRAYLVLPLFYLIVAIITGRSLTHSAVEAMGLVVIVSWLGRSSRLWPGAIIKVLAQGGARVITVAIPCAAAGIIVAVVAQTGIGLRFSDFLIGLSGDNVYIAMVVVMIGCLIMGMGLPTTAAYIMAATLFAPALSRMGIPPIGAHMFVFYFSCMSMITPPVALASYAAASIAETSSGKTGLTAAWLGIPVFLLPYAFISNTALLFQGTVLAAVTAFAVALLGISALMGGILGYYMRPMKLVERILLGISGIAIVFPWPYGNYFGFALLAAVVLASFLLAGRFPGKTRAARKDI